MLTKANQASAAEARKQNEDRKRLLRLGKFLRTSALGHEKRVKVLFRNMDGDILAYLMAARTYRAIPLLANVTPDDFRRHGAVRIARNLDLGSPY